MNFKIVWDKDALGKLRKLDKLTAGRIVKKFRNILLNPERHTFSLVNLKYSKIRVGNYRVFVDIEKDIITVRTIKHRRNAYKK